MTFPKGSVVVKYKGEYYEARPWDCGFCTADICGLWDIGNRSVLASSLEPVTPLARELRKKVMQEYDLS
jgi:hypothetical protein